MKRVSLLMIAILTCMVASANNQVVGNNDLLFSRYNPITFPITCHFANENGERLLSFNETRITTVSDYRLSGFSDEPVALHSDEMKSVSMKECYQGANDVSHKIKEDLLTKTPYDELTPSRTSVFEGIKCNHYVVEDNEETLRFRVFIKDNGDYAEFEEDELDIDRKPKGYAIGYRITTNEGNVYIKGGLTTAVITAVILASGNVMLELFEPVSTRIGWEEFKQNKHEHLNLYTIFFADNDEPAYATKEGYCLGDRYFFVDAYGNALPSHAQKFGERIYFANSTDTIVDVRIDNANGVAVHHISYANGDTLCITENGKKERDPGYWFYDRTYYDLSDVVQGEVRGSIHRNGGVLHITEKGKRIKYKDGSTCLLGAMFLRKRIGGVTQTNDYRWFNAGFLGHEELTCSFFTMYYPDGTSEEYHDGLSETEIKRKREAEARAEQQKLQKQYQDACKLWGKKYVDALLTDGRPIVGMPEGLLKRAFETQVVRELNGSTLYAIKGYGSIDYGSSISIEKVTKFTVWVSGGRVTSVRYW